MAGNSNAGNQVPQAARCALSIDCSVKGVVHPSLFGKADWKNKPSAPKGEPEWTSTTMLEPAQEVEN